MSTPGLSRRALLAGGGALLLAACSKPVTINRPTASPTGTVRQQLESVMGIIAKDSDKIGISLRDLRSNKTYAFRGDYSSQSASMAKPMIVSMAMRKARADGGALSRENTELARKAIENSDNDAADALWAYAGGRPAYAKLAAELKLRNTRPDPGKDFWSWTWTTPDDQRSFMEQLIDGTPALTKDERATLLGWMHNVEADQAWGVGTPRSASVEAWIKNGWVQFESTDKLWAVNSIGQVKGEGRDYVLTIMTRTPDFDTGKALTSEIGSQVFAILGSGKLA